MLDTEGNMIYQDLNHLNIKGSYYAAPFIIEELRKQVNSTEHGN